jgi:protein TonB
MAKQTGLEGDVVISAEVDAAGKVVAAKALDGPMILRQAAVDAVRGWKYEPALVNGEPSSAQVTVKIQFRLK